MIVFGIDPGSTVTGFGVVERSRGRLYLRGCGCVRTSSDTAIGDRLAAIHRGLVAALA